MAHSPRVSETLRVHGDAREPLARALCEDDAVRVHETVMRWVQDELEGGRLHVGDHLPGERALAETLGVSRSSLREALRVLEALGALQTSTGSGPRAGTIVTAEPGQAMSLALSLQVATKQVAHADILETRLLLERWAAEHSDPDRGDWEALERVLQRMDEPAIGLAEFLRLDAEFHVMASRAADNPLISTLMEALRLAIFEHTLTRARALPDWVATATRLRAEHRGVLEALQAGRGADAAELLDRHISGYYDETSRAAPPLADA